MKKGLTYEERKNRVDKHKRLAAKHRTAILELFAGCTHDELENKSMYLPESYHDKESTDYWDECKLCGKRFNERTKTGSSYG
jgi:hypothetical protein